MLLMLQQQLLLSLCTCCAIACLNRSTENIQVLLANFGSALGRIERRASKLDAVVEDASYVTSSDSNTSGESGKARGAAAAIAPVTTSDSGSSIAAAAAAAVASLTDSNSPLQDNYLPAYGRIPKLDAVLSVANQSGTPARSGGLCRSSEGNGPTLKKSDLDKLGVS
jgi:ABC-type transporter Mla subunit MlaD